MYTHSQDVAELGFESRSPYPQALPILLIRLKSSCLDHVLGGLLARLWEHQDLSASFSACVSSVLCRDSSALLRTRSGSCSWLARRLEAILSLLSQRLTMWSELRALGCQISGS